MAVESVLVVIPTLGERPDKLDEAIESALSQSGVHVRIVLVAPQVPDGDVRSMVENGDVDFVADPGRGLSAAVNAGIAAQREEEFLSWIGDDDVLAPNGLNVLTQILASRRNAVVAYGACGYIDDAGNLIGTSRAGAWASRILPWGPDLVPQPASLYRLSAIARAGQFDETLKYAMDLDMFLRLKRLGEFVATDQETARFRWHATSLTVANRADSLEESERVKRRYLAAGLLPFAPAWEVPVRFATRLAVATVNHRARRVSG